MTLQDFYEDFKHKSTYITDLSIRHILDKKYKLDDDITHSDIKAILSDYYNYIVHLNDFGFTIYKEHNTSIDDIYKECMAIFELDYDNKSYFEFKFTKLQTKINAKSNIQDKDILETLLSNIDIDIKAIENLKYFQNNKKTLDPQLQELLSQC
jgi:hypothetical protein